MSEASIRITETLDLDAVLQAVVDGACSLTGARHGGVTFLDDERNSPVFITSGMTQEERQLLFDLPGGPEFSEHLSGLPEPLRVADFSAYARELGLPEIAPPLGPVGAFLGAPINHLGRRVGNFYLSDKEGGAEFTAEDEGMLALFASQAALAIANARRYRAEQRARADLETLVNTSPVGVVVFDAGTGTVSFINREALRIVDGLRDPGQSPEQLLEVVSFRRADGREFSLKAYPLSRALGSGETVRAEEISITVPDGRRVSTVLNATPIASEEGDVASMVVTLQDMTPIEDLGRQRGPVSGHGEPGAAGAPHLHQGFRRRRAGGPFPAGRRQGSPVFHHHRVAGRPDARPDLGPAGDGPHRGGYAVPDTRTHGLGVPRGDRRQATFLDGGSDNPVEVDVPTELPLVAADRQRALQVLGRLLSSSASYSSEGSVITVRRPTGGLARSGVRGRPGPGRAAPA